MHRGTATLLSVPSKVLSVSANHSSVTQTAGLAIKAEVQHFIEESCSGGGMIGSALSLSGLVGRGLHSGFSVQVA